jgi:3',5'-cyclic AMP phosphodiesterase CpdA
MRPSRRLAAVAATALLAAGMLSPIPTSAAVTVLVGAGDIARCDSSADEATAALLGKLGGTVFTTGDNAYPGGSTEDFENCYAPSWGAFLTKTRPSPGNHDYATADAAGYHEYFRWRAGPGDRGYYAYERGDWRIYSLDSQRITDAQLDWLSADLAAHPSRCTMAYWHHPLFSSGQHGNSPEVKAFWSLLYQAGVEIVVNGHDHDYERFAMLRPGGTRSSTGIRQFVVGTGGAPLRPFADVQPNSLARDATHHGVLRLVLRAETYAWQFVRVDGSVGDSGTGRCHTGP